MRGASFAPRRIDTVIAMSSLKAEPAGVVETLDEFFALAHAIETDALARYTETAKQLRQQGAPALAAVFDQLAEAERGHVGQVTAWAEHRDAAHPSNSTSIGPFPILSMRRLRKWRRQNCSRLTAP